jgi:hypothetical protein
MYEQPGNTHNEHMHITHAGWMYVALVVIAFAAVIGTGFGVYYLQQGQVESLEKALAEKSHMNVASSKEITAAEGTVQFAEQQIPYTFSYPSDWVKAYNAPIDTASSQSKYVITLTAPSTKISSEPMGTEAVKAGAIVKVRMESTPFKTIQEVLAAYPAQIKLNERKNMTVSGIPAIEYRMAYESQDTFYTDFIKDGKLYQFIFVAGDGLQGSKHFQAYKDLLASVKFK